MVGWVGWSWIQCWEPNLPSQVACDPTALSHDDGGISIWFCRFSSFRGLAPGTPLQNPGARQQGARDCARRHHDSAGD